MVEIGNQDLVGILPDEHRTGSRQLMVGIAIGWELPKECPVLVEDLDIGPPAVNRPNPMVGADRRVGIDELPVAMSGATDEPDVLEVRIEDLDTVVPCLANGDQL